MKLVIDISEELYAKVPTLFNKGNIWIGDILEAVKNGTPLPKGHGRLIDADNLCKTMWAYMLDKSKNHEAQYVMSVAKCMVEAEHTILKADGGSEDEANN